MRDLLGTAEATSTAGDGNPERVDVARSPRLDLPRLLALASAATPGPWFSAYSDAHIACEIALDVKLAAEGREAVDDDFDHFPNARVAGVPPSHGDTPGAQAGKDAAFIAASREAVPALIAELSAARPAAALLVRAREALSEIVALCVDPEDKRVDLAKNLVLACGIAKEALVAIGEAPEGRV